LIKQLNTKAVVYDCNGRALRIPARAASMLEREKELLAHADLVFTGGPSLYEAKKSRHQSVHCFSSSVDTTHFGKAKPESDLAEAPEQASFPGPKLGFLRRG